MTLIRRIHFCILFFLLIQISFASDNLREVNKKESLIIVSEYSFSEKFLNSFKKGTKFTHSIDDAVKMAKKGEYTTILLKPGSYDYREKSRRGTVKKYFVHSSPIKIPSKTDITITGVEKVDVLSIMDKNKKLLTDKTYGMAIISRNQPVAKNGLPPRIFEVGEGARLILEDLLIDGGTRYHGDMPPDYKKIGLNDFQIQLSAEAEIEDRRFYKNVNEYSNNGGCIHVEKGGELIISNSVIFTCASSSYGGAVYVEGGRLEISHSVFAENLSEISGGAIASYNSSIDIVNSRFTHNLSMWSGGAIFVNGDTLLQIENSFFQNNSAEIEGGAILLNNFVSGSIQALISTTSFSENESFRQGGAISIRNKQNITIENSSFTGNKGHLGGSIYSYKSNLKVKNSVFEKSVALFAGGAIFSNKSNLTSITNFYHSNKVGDNNILKEEPFTSLDGLINYIGGAIYSAKSNLTTSDDEFYDNYAADAGGAIFYCDSYPSHEFINHSIYKRNKTGTNQDRDTCDYPYYGGVYKDFQEE